MATGRSGIVRPEIAPTARDRRVITTVPVAIGLRESLAATRSFHVVRRGTVTAALEIVAAHARILATVPTAARNLERIAAIQSRGRSAMRLHPITPDAILDPPAMARETSINLASTSRARIAPEVIDLRATGRFASDRNSIVRGKVAMSGRVGIAPASIVRAKIARSSNGPVKVEVLVKVEVRGRSTRAATRVPRIGTTGRGVTMRMTARSSPSVRRSAAGANIASASPISTNARRVRRAKRSPASVSPRWCRGRDWPRAATRRNGSCRAASPSTAA